MSPMAATIAMVTCTRGSSLVTPRHAAPDRSCGDADRAPRIDESLHPPQELGQIVAELALLGDRGFFSIAALVVHRARVLSPPTDAALGRDKAD